MIGHIGRARKGPRANADLDEYSNYCRRSPERLVGVQLRGGLWGMDRRAHSRPVDCCSSRLHSSGVFCPAHRFGVEARCVKALEVRSPPPTTAQRRPWNGVSGLALVGRAWLYGSSPAHQEFGRVVNLADCIRSEGFNCGFHHAVSAIEQLFRFFLRPRWMYSFRTTTRG